MKMILACAQRLMRRICSHCKEPVTYPGKMYADLNIDPSIFDGVTLYRGRGCERCKNSGYAGRLAIIEMLKATMRTREYIEMGEKEGKSLLDAMRDGALDGMQYFDGELEKLVRAGTISMNTALLYATNAGNLKVALADVPDEDSLITR